MEELGTGKLMKYGGGLLALIGVVLAAIGTTSAGTFALYGALVLVGAGLMKLGDHLDKRQAAEARKRNPQEQQ